MLVLTMAVMMTTPGPIVQQGHGIVQSGPTSWSPFGPRTDRLTITVYDDFQLMFDAFVRGELDITDFPVLQQDEASFGANPDMYLTDGQPEFGIFDLEINQHNTFLGVPMQENRGSDSFNSPSTKQPTAAGIQIRKALAHLLDKPDFMNVAALRGRASYDDIQIPPLQGLAVGGAPPSRLPAAVLAEDCADHPWFTPCDANNPPVSAYNLVADSLPDPFNAFADRGYSGTADLRAACDHFVLAGITMTPSAATCADVVAGTAKLVSGGQKVIVLARTHPPRKAFGTIIFDALNSLFDQQVTVPLCPPTYYSLCFADPIFRTDPDRDDWNLYTGGWFLGSFPDHLYSLYHSQFASNPCGGKKANFAANYVFYCSPEFDQEALAGQSSSSLAEANTHFTNAALTAHRQVMTIPVYSGAGQKFVALNGWNFQPGTGSSLVSQIGHGFQTGFWSLLNMRQKPGYVPADSRYAPGGGDPNLIRRSSKPVNKLSPFHATTVWEFEVLDQIYDSMLKVNPLTAGPGQQLIDWMAVRHSSSFNPSEVFAGVTGVTTQTWVLRGDLRWHDGVPLTAEDVAFSLVKYRDVPSSNLQPSVVAILDAVARDSRTVQVKLAGQSIFFELNIGSLPIIPKHVWEPLGDAVMGDPGFDPMMAGVMIGSGPRVCKNLDTGAVGGSCVRPDCPPGGICALGGQVVGALGRIFLTAYDGYHRGRLGVADSSLHKFSWADRNNDGKVDIVDIADVAFHFGGPDAYWNTGQNAAAPQTIGTDASIVDIGEVANVAFYFEYGLVKPFSLSQVIGLDPDIDPFF